MHRLRDQSNGKRIEYRGIATESVGNIKPIPENLQFLNANRVLPNSYNIILADCLDEHISLGFTRLESENPEIILSWSAPTMENPYNSESQLLWPKGK